MHILAFLFVHEFLDSFADPFVLSHNLGAALSLAMVKFIRSTFERARVRFGTAQAGIPYVGQERQRYFFDPFFLTNGYLPPADRNCKVCGKIGHWAKECPYNKSKRGKGQNNKNEKGQQNNTDNGQKKKTEKKEQSKTGKDKKELTEKVQEKKSGEERGNNGISKTDKGPENKENKVLPENTPQAGGENVLQTNVNKMKHNVEKSDDNGDASLPPPVINWAAHIRANSEEKPQQEQEKSVKSNTEGE